MSTATSALKETRGRSRLALNASRPARPILLPDSSAEDRANSFMVFIGGLLDVSTRRFLRSPWSSALPLLVLLRLADGPTASHEGNDTRDPSPTSTSIWFKCRTTCLVTAPAGGAIGKIPATPELGGTEPFPLLGRTLRGPPSRRPRVRRAGKANRLRVRRLSRKARDLSLPRVVVAAMVVCIAGMLRRNTVHQLAQSRSPTSSLSLHTYHCEGDRPMQPMVISTPYLVSAGGNLTPRRS